jgi:hypothetical protein
LKIESSFWLLANTNDSPTLWDHLDGRLYGGAEVTIFFGMIQARANANNVSRQGRVFSTWYLVFSKTWQNRNRNHTAGASPSQFQRFS